MHIYIYIFHYFFAQSCITNNPSLPFKTCKVTFTQRHHIHYSTASSHISKSHIIYPITTVTLQLLCAVFNAIVCREFLRNSAGIYVLFCRVVSWILFRVSWIMILGSWLKTSWVTLPFIMLLSGILRYWTPC